MSSDLSDWFGGSCNYSHKEREEINLQMHCISNIKKFTIGKELVKMYKRQVKKSRREFFPMEDWIKVQYNHYS